MSDIASTISSDGVGDYAIAAGQLAVDDGLRTAVVISLFTDRAATDDDIAAGLADERRGCWIDAIDKDLIGSRLWLLRRATLTEAPVQRCREYAEEALAWLIEDGVAQRIVTTAEVAAPGVLALVVEIYRPLKAPVKYRFDAFWGGM